MADSSRLRGWKYDHHNNYLEVFVNGTQVAYFDDATNDLRLLTNGMTIDAGGMTITEGNVTLTDGDLSVTGTTTLIGEVTVTGGVTWTGASNVTLTAPTTADDAFYGQIVASAGWTAGNMVGIRGNVTLSGTANYVSATGGWFGLDFSTKTGSGSGLTCAINAEVTSNNATAPNAIVYLQSLPNGSTADFSNVPFIAFTEYAASGTGSNILFSLGHQPAGANRNVTTGTSGNIIYQQTLHIIANGSDAYIPYSTVPGAFTTAYLIQSSLATGSTTTGSGAVIIAGGVGIGGAVNAGSYISVPQGSQLYLDGPGGAEYIRSGTVGYLLASATTAVDLGIGGVTKVRVQTAEVEFQAGVYVDILGDLGVSNSLTVVGNCTFSGTDVGIAGTLTVITAINNGYDAAGGAVNMYADITGHGVFFDPTADTNQGSLTVGATGGSKGTDLYCYGVTNGSYMLWDQSADDLLLAGLATISVTLTAPTAVENAIEGLANLTNTWASGEVNAVYGKTTITLASDGSTYSAAGGHFELEFSGNATSGLGLTAACMCKFTSDVEQPNAILYLESYPTGTCDMSETPFITFCDYKAGSGVKSNTLLRIGDPVMAQTISTGDGKLSYNQTLRCSIYDDTSSRAIYLVTSSAQGTYTTAYPIVSTSTIGVTIAALTAGDTYSGIRCNVTAAAANNAYGAAAYFQTDATGTFAGHVYGIGSWINFSSSADAQAFIVAAQDNGLYGTITCTSAKIIFGMRMEAVITGTPQVLAPFSINVGTGGITALFAVDALAAISWVSGTPTSGSPTGSIPILCDNNGASIKYVHTYDSRN